MIKPYEFISLLQLYFKDSNNSYNYSEKSWMLEKDSTDNFLWVRDFRYDRFYWSIINYKTDQIIIFKQTNIITLNFNNMKEIVRFIRWFRNELIGSPYKTHKPLYWEDDEE